MPTSTEPHATTLYEALMRAQQAFRPVVKNATNKHLQSQYADLGSVIDAIIEPLHSNGLLFIQTIQTTPDGPELVTMLIMAATGDKLESHAPIISKDPQNPQSFGAAVTYMRRYSLLAMCGLAPEDDDGHAATQHTTTRATTSPERTRQHDKPAEVMESPAMTDKEFDDAVRAALNAKDGQAYRDLVTAAGNYSSRWIVLVKNADTDRSLRWVEKQAKTAGVANDLFQRVADKRQQELNASEEIF